MKPSVAIPDSCLEDCATNMDKTSKLAQMARALAIFGVQAVYVYDHGGRDGELIQTVLRYADTPQFLRRRLFPRMSDLRYAGVLHPLKIASHTTPADPASIKKNTVRDGITVRMRGRMFVDFGINRLLPYHGEAPPNKRIIARFASGTDYVEIQREEAPEYWGYAVKKRGRLSKFISSWTDAVLFTSRRGRAVSYEDVRGYRSMAGPLLIVFGSVEFGIHQILGRSPNSVPNSRVLDFFPNQNTETVRLEEAMLGVLSILSLP